jgi:hypothetical protein
VSAGTVADLLQPPTAVVTVGAPILDEALAAQGVATVPVEWRPPPASSVAAVTAVTGDPQVAEANRTAVGRMSAARPRLVDVVPAAEAVGIGRHQLLHAGPPIGWEAASASTRAGPRRLKRPRPWPPPGRSSWRRATTTARWGRWPAS